MNHFTYLILTIFVCALMSFVTRLVPFALFGRSGQPPKIISDLGKVLPSAVMAILVIYCLKDVDFSSLNSIMPQALGILIVALLHLYKRNNLISIGGGTLAYMLLVQFVF